MVSTRDEVHRKSGMGKMLTTNHSMKGLPMWLNKNAHSWQHSRVLIIGWHFPIVGVFVHACRGRVLLWTYLHFFICIWPNLYAGNISLLNIYIIFKYRSTVNKYISISFIMKHLSYWRLTSEELCGFTLFVHTYYPH